jgi:hypothetical protein
MKVKRKGKVTKARCSPQEKNRSGIDDDFSDDEYELATGSEVPWRRHTIGEEEYYDGAGGVIEE